MATVRFSDQKKRQYEYQVDGVEGRALLKVYEHLSMYPADAVDLVVKVVADPEATDPDNIAVVELPFSSVLNFSVRTSAEDHTLPVSTEYSGLMHSIRDRRQLVIDALA